MRHDTETTILNWDQLRRVLAKLSLKDRLILELDMTDPLRPSELLGLRWRDFNYDECLLVLRETVYRRKLRNWGKTRKALRPVQIPKELATISGCGGRNPSTPSLMTSFSQTG